ncbi:VOC family protein [Devosia lacusdianchii]|uniref:VOC family protein n=1 Tax=Devosia lacusdianchii TaxID=2917991 RepID=UPI001F06055D|nr:VOC family protein [Devosia sp. JXJ CY 41]
MIATISIGLPIESRRRACDFYRKALGLEMVGEIDKDGMSEPLQFALDTHTRLTLIPHVGFGWMVGDIRRAPGGKSECLLTLQVETLEEVRRVFKSCIDAGAKAIEEPIQKDWGYVAIIADPDTHLWMIAANLW